MTRDAADPAPDELEQLLQQNRRWARLTAEAQPDFFTKLEGQQSPRFLWIGCSDSRVPANQILGLLPGEIFVHRNVANVVVHSDLNCLSVIQFAVEVLKVEHIIVCGHYGCGGVKAALLGQKLGLIDNWLRHVQDVYKRNQSGMLALQDDKMRLNRLCELNALEQAINVAQTTLLQDAWARDQQISVHALVYGLHDGILRRLGKGIASPSDIEAHRLLLG
ncbi:MAG: carbonate dehydratase [Steroidobacteraceae bacterium]